jgi:hypothetical protein
LHNALLDIDGISSQWKDGVLVSNWDGELGQMNFNGLRESVPNSTAQLITNLNPHNYDLSNMGPGEDVVGKISRGDSGEEEEIELGQMMPVNSLSLVLFQHKLVDHFTIMFTCNLIKWPKNRKGKGVGR